MLPAGLHETAGVRALELREAGERTRSDADCADPLLVTMPALRGGGTVRLLDGWDGWSGDSTNVPGPSAALDGPEGVLRGIELGTCLIWEWGNARDDEGVRW